MKAEIKFKVGDRVYSPFHDCGTVTKIIQNEAYPIEVTWDVSRYKHEKDVSTFTPDGFLWLGDKRDYTKIIVVGEAAEDRHKFKVGDRVSFPYRVLGTVIAKHDDERDYPIKIKWDKSSNGQKFSTFTPDGFLAESHLEDADRLTVVGRSMPEEEEEMAEESKFKVGDRVYFKSRGYGTIIELIQNKPEEYPIVVRWDDTNVFDTFTPDGYLWSNHTYNAPQLTVVDKAKGETEMGKIAGVINHNITSKENEKMDTKSEKFKVGDRVWSPHFDDGIVTDIDDDKDFPIEVQWCGGHTLTVHEYFTKDGKYDLTNTNPDFNIYLVKPEMADVPSKKVDDAINPSHYKVDGLPEAIDIINHLMHREQYEGFLWGNILKYAYRFGRKGDKAETAGKIAWYATQLKELEEEKRK